LSCITTDTCRIVIITLYVVGTILSAVHDACKMYGRYLYKFVSNEIAYLCSWKRIIIVVFHSSRLTRSRKRRLTNNDVDLVPYSTSLLKFSSRNSRNSSLDFSRPPSQLLGRKTGFPRRPECVLRHGPAVTPTNPRKAWNESFRSVALAPK